MELTYGTNWTLHCPHRMLRHHHTNKHQL